MCGAFHDRITVDWSTKFTVKFCGADGGSINVQIDKISSIGQDQRYKVKKLTCTRHFLRIFLGPKITGVASTFGESVIGGFAVSRTSFATVRPSFVFEFTDRALGARLLLDVSLIARFAVTSTVRQVPFAISFAEEGWLFDDHGVVHASADRLFDQRDFATRWRCREVCKVHRDLRTADVVNFNGQDGDASSLIAEREVHALLRHWNGLDLRVYNHPGVSVEPSLASSDASCGSNDRFRLATRTTAKFRQFYTACTIRKSF